MRTSLSKHLRYKAPLLAIAAMVAGAACGSGGSSNTGGAGGTGSSSSSTTSTASSSSSSGAGGTAPTCPGPGYGGNEETKAVSSVTATLIDQNGAPVAGQPVYICGTDICSDPAMSGPDGKVTITTTLSMKKPAFKFGDAVAFSELGIPLSTTTTDVGTVGTAKLPASGVVLTADADAKSGNVTLSIPKGAAIVVNELIYDTPEKQQFRAVEMPIAQEAPVLDPVQINGMPANFELVFGIGPATTTICPAAKVTVPNSKSWAAGTKVEFWVMTLDAGQEFAPYAGWAKASDGEVSADGATVSTVDGGGFVYLDNFAIRKVP
ncbi:MAG: hypothetical protein QM820_05865 [Minicystis sp.]